MILLPLCISMPNQKELELELVPVLSSVIVCLVCVLI